MDECMEDVYLKGGCQEDGGRLLSAVLSSKTRRNRQK